MPAGLGRACNVYVCGNHCRSTCTSKIYNIIGLYKKNLLEPLLSLGCKCYDNYIILKFIDTKITRCSWQNILVSIL